MIEVFTTHGTASEYLASVQRYIQSEDTVNSQEKPLGFDGKLLRMGLFLPQSEILYPDGRHECLIQTSSVEYQEKNDTAIVVIAHPDDEAFVGGTIRKLRKAKKQVIVIALTSGNASPTVDREYVIAQRQTEAHSAMQRLDVNFYLNLGFTDGDLLYQRAEVTKQLIQYLRIFDGTVVIGHNSHEDYHLDHTEAGSITQEALFKARNANHVQKGIPVTQTIPAYYQMDTQGSKISDGTLAHVTHVVKLDKRTFQEKAYAFDAHGSQVFEQAPDGKNTHRERLRIDTRQRGHTAGTSWGEGLSQVSFGGEAFSTKNILQQWLGKHEVITIPKDPIRRSILRAKGLIVGIAH